MRKILRRSKRNPESGMTLIELMIAAVVLIFGMLSIMGLLMLAIGNNGRSKIDSTATMLSQVVVEQVSAKLAGGGPGSITDNSACGAGPGTTHTINDDPGGANLVGSKIDFSEAQGPLVANNYAMNYVDCNNNVQMEYDVRWNIQSVGANGTNLVTVGARPKSGLPTRFAFALPVTIRAYVGGN
jgi:type II secretory pathway pseudopilin PulG